MELESAMVIAIDKLINEWVLNETMELEAVFGEEGVVDATTFLAVAQRLQAKGYVPEPVDDRLSILVPAGLRFSIHGAGVLSTLQSYCKDDTLQGKPYSVMAKSRHSPGEKSKETVEDYSFYLKNRIEENVPPSDSRVTELLDTWPQVEKAFRLIKRWSFKGQGMKIDLSMVRSTPDLNKMFLWQRKFKERDIFQQPVRYEIEVELDRTDEIYKDKSKEELKIVARRCLVRGIGEILRAIQKNSFLIKKSEIESVKMTYAALNKSAAFRGVQPITMELKHMSADLTDTSVANVRTNYNVTDKADGLRTLAYCNPQGELFLLDSGMNVYKTGLMNVACVDSLLDAEWVTKTREHKAISYVLLFDIYYLNGKNVSGLPFHLPDSKETRHGKMEEWIKDWNGDSDGGIKRVVPGMTESNRFQVKLKHFEFADPANPNTIFLGCATILRTKQIYETDGLILSPNTKPLPSKSAGTFWDQVKWKPANMNTIDFLVQFEKKRGSTLDRIEMGPHPETGESVSYKTLRLFISAKRDTAYDDPRATVLNLAPLPVPEYKRTSGRSEKNLYQISYFIPEDYPDTMASTCYLPIHLVPESGDEFVETADTHEPIIDNMIVEMRYDPTKAPGWRWIPMRIRHDKTERFAKKIVQRTLNSDVTAKGVWNSIHNPITESMISTGAESPNREELVVLKSSKRYYDRKATKSELNLVSGLRQFHNHYIKEQLLYRSVLGLGNKTVLDLACGPGGDLDFWAKKYKAAFMLGVDIDRDNIYDTQNGIYRRYLNYLVRFGRDKVPPAVFVHADSSKPLLKGLAAFGEDDATILKTLFAREKPDGTPPPLLMKTLNARLKDGVDVATCMFALHYFLKDKETFDGFLDNLRDCVKVGGYFMGCCTDGQRVFDRLKDLDQDDVAVGKEGETVLWSITKRYDSKELRADDSSVGLPIDVNFITIGTEHTEYLVSFPYLQKRLEEIGFVLLTPKELAALPGGLEHSTNLFKDSYKMAPKGTEYAMNEVEKEFSFLSRWFIFKRRSALDVAEEEEEVETEGEEELEEGTVTVVGKKSAPKGTAPTYPEVLETSNVFQFGPEVRVPESFDLKDTPPPQIVAPYWPFPIEEEGITYPSLEHYWAAMKLIHASNKPDVGAEIAPQLFAQKGIVHQAALKKMSEDGIDIKAKLTKPKKTKFLANLLQELIKIREIMAPTALEKTYKLSIDDAKWNGLKEMYYRKGLSHRWSKDALFHATVEKARAAKQYLLYYQTKRTGDPKGEFSGVHEETGRISGGNSIGKLIMDIAKFVF